MTWTVWAAWWWCCVEALTEAVAAAARCVDPQVAGADGEIRLAFLIQERDEFGGEIRVDVAQQWPLIAH